MKFLLFLLKSLIQDYGMWVYISLLLLMTVFPTMGGLSFGFVMSRPLLLSEISPVYWISLPVGVWGGVIFVMYYVVIQENFKSLMVLGLLQFIYYATMLIVALMCDILIWWPVTIIADSALVFVITILVPAFCNYYARIKSEYAKQL
jgi:hypothetical protein